MSTLNKSNDKNGNVWTLKIAYVLDFETPLVITETAPIMVLCLQKSIAQPSLREYVEIPQ